MARSDWKTFPLQKNSIWFQIRFSTCERLFFLFVWIQPSLTMQWSNDQNDGVFALPLPVYKTLSNVLEKLKRGGGRGDWGEGGDISQVYKNLFFSKTVQSLNNLVVQLEMKLHCWFTSVSTMRIKGSSSVRYLPPQLVSTSRLQVIAEHAFQSQSVAKWACCKGKIELRK